MIVSFTVSNLLPKQLWITDHLSAQLPEEENGSAELCKKNYPKQTKPKINDI